MEYSGANIRVPLLDPVDAVISRLDIQATQNANPVGPATSGYDRHLREPVISRTAGGIRQVATQYMAQIRVPCQVKVLTDDELSMIGDGNAPMSRRVLVMHRGHLETLGLLRTSGDCVLKTGDRLDRMEKRRLGLAIETFIKPLFVFEVAARGWGMGPAGRDLVFVTLMHRNPVV